MLTIKTSKWHFNIDCSNPSFGQAGKIYDSACWEVIGYLVYEYSGIYHDEYTVFLNNDTEIGKLVYHYSTFNSKNYVRFIDESGNVKDIPPEEFQGSEEIIARNIMGGLWENSQIEPENKQARAASSKKGQEQEPPTEIRYENTMPAISVFELFGLAIIPALLFWYLSRNIETTSLIIRNVIGLLLPAGIGLIVIISKRKLPMGKSARNATALCFFFLIMGFLFYTAPSNPEKGPGIAFAVFAACWIPKFFYSIYMGNLAKYAVNEEKDAIDTVYRATSKAYTVLTSVMELHNSLVSGPWENLFGAIIYAVPAIITLIISMAFFNWITNLPYRKITS